MLLDAYAAGKLKAVYLCYTRFINTMRQEPVIEQLLPLSDEQMQKEEGKHGWDYIYEPDARVVIDELLVRYVEALVYQATAENMASEQSARMVAMKSATDNAGNVIAELKLVYNKTRQAGDHQRTLRDRRRRRGGLAAPIDGPTNLNQEGTRTWLTCKPPAAAQGKIVQCIGAVVDVEFPRDAMPKVYDALKMEGSALTLEVQQQLGDGVVRTIALGSSDGLRRGMMINNTGKRDLGAGRPGDARPHHGRARQPDRRARPGRARTLVASIHRKPPAYDELSPSQDLLETGIKVIDLSARSPRAARSACSAAPASARPST